MILRTLSLLTVATAICSTSARAQINFPETEPNSVKAEANPIVGIVAGDYITGNSQGTVVTAGSTLATSADTFRVQTGALPLGIYRHTLTITTTGTVGHTGTLRGLTQLNGVISTTDTAFQTSSTTVAPIRGNIWYGFGRQEEVYYRVTGTATTTANYTSTLATAAITPINVAGAFAPGTVTVTTIGQGHTNDTEIFLYDSNLNPIAGGHNDDQIAGIAGPSQVALTLAAGTYYIAVSNYNTSNDQSDLNALEGYDDGAVLDFPNAIANTSTSLTTNIAFAVTDGVTTTQTAATHANSFEIVWAKFTVVGPNTPTTPFCFGDGTGAACPCGNTGAAGNGCANSLNAAGANLSGTGAASISGDTFVIAGVGMPNSSALYFQGTSQAGAGLGVNFGDGLRCAGGSVIRLGTKANSGGGSQYPVGADPLISVKGLNAAGNVRTYQVWYRNAAAFCNPETFNLSNGLQVTWIP